MLVKINGKLVEVIDFTFPELRKLEDYLAEKDRTFFDWENAHTPDLSEPPQDFIDLVDKFNYSLFSKTETTEFFYRVIGTYAKDLAVTIQDLSELIF